MKYVAFLLLLGTLAFSQATPAASPASSQSIPVDQENANKAKALLDQMIQALGGNAYLNIEDASLEGRAYSMHHGESGGPGMLFWEFYKYPDKERVELTKKRDIVYVYRGDQGFEITYRGARADDPKTVSDVLRRRRYALDVVLRKWLHEPGMALFYEGATVAEQKDVQQVTLLNSQNQGVTLYIDSRTFLPVKKTYSWRDPTDKERNIESEVYDAYRAVQGIMTPFIRSRYYNGDMVSQHFLNSVSFNTGVKDSLFNVVVTWDPNKPVPRK
ncbi:MAG: hypothetical protein LAO09_18745 [Acidobacteriia bacterium]|nr:hypothetical protein [Terriglobia bacterium]